ncbi:MAG: sensor domain-containing diguanylate cyclase [Nitrospirota bacterium]
MVSEGMPIKDEPNIEGMATRIKELEKLNEELNKKVIESFLLYKISKVLQFNYNIDDALSEVMNIIKDASGIEHIAIMLLDPQEKILRIRAAHGLKEGTIKEVSFEIGEGVVGEVAETGKPALISDVSKDKRFSFFKGWEPQIGSFIAVPLKLKEGIIGVLSVHSDEKGRFLEKDLIFMTQIGEDLSLAIEKANIFNSIWELAIKDELCGIYNRRYLLEAMNRELIRAKRNKAQLSLLMIDIDDFKVYNDTLGHLAGDDALRTVAKIASNTLRVSDIIARYGGEEFVALLPDTTKDGAVITAEKIRHNIENKKLTIESLPLKLLTVSIGIATFPEDVKTPGDLLYCADLSMYNAKRNGKNQVKTYTKGT